MIKRKTILFVDDNPVDRALIERVLTKNGFHVMLADHAEGGMRLAREKKPALILLDILLPGISGIEVCKLLKKDSQAKDIPVVFYTSIDTPRHLIDFASYGAIDYLQKTMPTEELIAALKGILNMVE